MTPSGIALAVLAPITVILNLPPLIWHIRNRNTAAASLVFWILLNNFLSVINLATWPNDNMDTWFSGRGLCDIEAKIMVARSTALPAATLCIIRALAAVINSDRTMIPSTVQRRRKMILELVWCLGIPVVTMFLHYIVQPNRYFIYGVSGCNPSVSVNWVTVVLLSIPPLLLSIANAWYGGLTLFRLRKYRTSFHIILASSNNTKSRFLRLFLIAAILTLALIPVEIYVLLRDIPTSQFDTFSWSEIHSKQTWNEIILMPSTVIFDRWLDVGVGFALFALFGCGRDAVGMYKSWAVMLGLGRIFPSLTKEKKPGTAGSGETFGSRARLFWRSRIGGSQATSNSLISHAPSPTTQDLPSTTSSPNAVPTSLLSRFRTLFSRREAQSANPEIHLSPASKPYDIENTSKEQILMMALPHTGAARGTVSADAWSDAGSRGDGGDEFGEDLGKGEILVRKEVRAGSESV